ncbi:hypothetical protein P171DRAFT_428384 [Karstenula rhodostoma CBS 690.94]|uniref:Uncharacterized protein n=1 Tax=Karstenula rhodostoma CBS 690.94 TaxID=1392251 RepID=A0A9P4UF98_9PLEO|nr:hypothetical protein P171DRAFT_428384 [Karstenula rhodostoma CBS 690.94]
MVVPSRYVTPLGVVSAYANCVGVDTAGLELKDQDGQVDPADMGFTQGSWGYNLCYRDALHGHGCPLPADQCFRRHTDLRWHEAVHIAKTAKGRDFLINYAQSWTRRWPSKKFDSDREGRGLPIAWPFPPANMQQAEDLKHYQQWQWSILPKGRQLRELSHLPVAADRGGDAGRGGHGSRQVRLGGVELGDDPLDEW